MSKGSVLTTTTATAEETRRSLAQKLLLCAGFAGLLFIATFVALGLAAPNYSSMRETISAIELTSLGAGQRINFFVFGLLLCGFAIALRRELRPGRGSAVIPLFQAVSGIAVIGDAIFIHFPLHLVCDLVAFLSTLAVLFAFGWFFRKDAHWTGWSAYSILTAILMMALLTCFGYANHAGGPAGLLEKSATGIRTLWSVLFAGKLLAGARLNFSLQN
jgi:hypothetical protein